MAGVRVGEADLGGVLVGVALIVGLVGSRGRVRSFVRAGDSDGNFEGLAEEVEDAGTLGIDCVGAKDDTGDLLLSSSPLCSMLGFGKYSSVGARDENVSSYIGSSEGD